MRITNWTTKMVAVIAAERGKSKTWKRLMAGAVVGGSLALAAGPADAQTNHAIQDASFDDRDLTAEGVCYEGNCHYAYINTHLSNYPWVPVGSNNNSWLYNTTYSDGIFTVSAPRSSDNAAHLAAGNLFQIIGDPFVSGREYTLSAWVRWDSDQWEGDDFGLRLFDGTSGMWDGAEIFAAEEYFFGVDIFNDNTWREMTLTFTAGANASGKPIGIYLGPDDQANHISVDDVTLTSIPAILAGDYNDDNIVDAADYVVWRHGGPLENDPTPESVDETDYTTWVRNFGRTGPVGSGAAAGQSLSAGSVPEPSTCLLACAAAAGFLILGRRSSGSWIVVQ